jgi:chromosome segregation ATPase
MQATSKLYKGLLVISSVAMAAAPLLAYAREDGNEPARLRRPEPKEDMRSSSTLENQKPPRATSTKQNSGEISFCVRLEKGLPEIKNKLGEKKQELAEKKQEQVKKLQEKSQENAKKLEEFRGKADDRREIRYDKLDQMAKTDAQKQAVAEFRTTVEAAIKTRKTAVDAAIQTFQQEMEKLAKQRQTDSEKIMEQLKSAMDKAMAQAKADCAAGMDPKTAKTNFEAAVKSAQKAFEDGKQGMKNLVPELEKTLYLQLVFKQAWEFALAQFKKILM